VAGGACIGDGCLSSLPGFHVSRRLLAEMQVLGVCGSGSLGLPLVLGLWSRMSVARGRDGRAGLLGLSEATVFFTGVVVTGVRAGGGTCF
jgi:hypothetical protein